jgi:hypothetical protein
MNNHLQLSLFDSSTFTTNQQRTIDPIQLFNISNIRKTVDKLYPEQHDDVLKAEKRFFQDNGKGILFTNGTGTGKTYSGLGIAKRFFLRGKKNILLIVPTDAKAKDWIIEATYIGLDITQLNDIKSKGKDFVITTYANFYQNKSLLQREFDLIIYDECHKLGQNASGKGTVYLEAHRIVANLPSTARQKAMFILPPKPFAPNYPERPNYSDPGYSKKMQSFDSLRKEYDKQYTVYQNKLIIWKEKFQDKTEEIYNRTKVVFLSATPFAYHKSCMIGDGTLWEINEKLEHEEEINQGYNVATGFAEFLTTHFGYHMRYNKATTPESGVDVNLLERMFHENMVEKGIISGRQLEVDMDYSRDFVTVSSELGYRINEGMKLFYSYDKEFSEKYKYLSQRVYRKWRYLYVNQLLEGLKAVSVIDRIKKHLELGRKVVVFHGYNNALPSHPFRFTPDVLLDAEDRDNSHTVQALREEIELFEREYPHLVNLEIKDVLNARLSMEKEFGGISREFNGTIPKKRRYTYIKQFNTKYSGLDLLLIQRKAGKEGISLHDIIGDSQRVLIDLGMPTDPTDAIQTEGRIYRLGVMSNAIFEYPVLNTDFEKIAFAEKVATRARTAENLAMGKKARNLETAFIEGYLNASNQDPSLLQGTGGLEADRNNIQTEITEFERAKTFYFARGKKTTATKSSEGVDYFATPEPLGLRMVEWLNLEANDDALEPSAGHGAIARFMQAHTNNTFVEPSYSLSAQLSINTTGEVKQQRFEDLHVINKYDGIAMNPPFGKSGKTAMEHIEKAFRHLRENGRIVSIIPCGQSMEKQLDKFLFGQDDKGKLINPNAHLIAEFILPNVTFSRAGTKVATRVVIIDKISDTTNAGICKKLDFSSFDKIDDFFNAIEDVSVRDRINYSNYHARAAS